MSRFESVGLFSLYLSVRQSHSPLRTPHGVVLSIEATTRKAAALIATISSADSENLPTTGVSRLYSSKDIKIFQFFSHQKPFSIFTMDMSTQMPMAGFFIYRSGEPTDPTALEFSPPKGSDELFFALKAAFPHVKTHSDRMRNAVIDFLKQELTEEQNQMAAPPLPMDSSLDSNLTFEPSFEASNESPWPSWPSMASSSTLSSPDLLNLATPASMSSSYAPTMSRQNSSARTNSAPKSKPGLEDMTGVFSLSTASQPKPRVRRKMTESELVQYRKRRIVKACDSCRERKRKCSHNQSEMQKVRSSKVTKSQAAMSKISSQQIQQVEKALFQPAEHSAMSEDPFMFLDQSLFSELPTNDPLFFNDAELESLFAPKETQASQQVSSTTWPWSDTPDWTLIDTPLHSHVSSTSPTYHQTLFPASTGLLSPQQTPHLELIHEPTEQARALEVPRTESQTPTRTWRTFSDFSRTAFSTADGLDGKEMANGQLATMGLSTPGDVVSPTQSRNMFSSLAPLTGTQPSSSSGLADRQSVPQADNSSRLSRLVLSQALGQATLQTSRLPISQTHRLVNDARPESSQVIAALTGGPVHAVQPELPRAHGTDGLVNAPHLESQQLWGSSSSHGGSTVLNEGATGSLQVLDRQTTSSAGLPQGRLSEILSHGLTDNDASPRVLDVPRGLRPEARLESLLDRRQRREEPVLQSSPQSTLLPIDGDGAQGSSQQSQPQKPADKASAPRPVETRAQSPPHAPQRGQQTTPSTGLAGLVTTPATSASNEASSTALATASSSQPTSEQKPPRQRKQRREVTPVLPPTSTTHNDNSSTDLDSRTISDSATRPFTQKGLCVATTAAVAPLSSSTQNNVAGPSTQEGPCAILPLLVSTQSLPPNDVAIETTGLETQVKAAVLVADVCRTWWAMAAAFTQAVACIGRTRSGCPDFGLLGAGRAAVVV